MTADQKKKLLWGNKKNIAIEEVHPFLSLNTFFDTIYTHCIIKFVKLVLHVRLLNRPRQDFTIDIHMETWQGFSFSLFGLHNSALQAKAKIS